MTRWTLLATACLLTAVSVVHANDPLAAFPAAPQGVIRHVLRLPPQTDESALRVELQAGQTVEVDERNHYFFPGSFSEEIITGWGYPRYLVGALGPLSGTRMAVDPNAPKRSRFVGLGGEPYLIRYNSRLPVVVYAPAGVEVRYRLWRAEDEARTMPSG